jgi:hypothetical protein
MKVSGRKAQGERSTSSRLEIDKLKKGRQADSLCSQMRRSGLELRIAKI